MSFTRGTTLQKRYDTDIDLTSASRIIVTFTQDAQIILEKELDSMTVDTNGVTVSLTPEETFKFSTRYPIKMQMYVIMNDLRLASNIMITSVEELLRREII